MEVGDIVRVVGVSKRGKSRVAEHGDEWTVVNNNLVLSRFKLISVKTDYIRWIDTKIEDKDFKVVEIVEKAEVKTLKQFLDKTGWVRGTNHPSKESLNNDFERFNVTEDAQIEIYTYFLYDNSEDDEEDC
jgi:hypothetical protein